MEDPMIPSPYYVSMEDYRENGPDREEEDDDGYRCANCGDLLMTRRGEFAVCALCAEYVPGGRRN